MSAKEKQKGNVVMSPCEKYRYVLRRPLGSILRWYRPCLFIMLNPSTADASVDDPTIRRCMNFAKREGMTHLTVVNRFALRATNPKELLNHPDPFGPENDFHLRDQLEKHRGGLIIAAWGANELVKQDLPSSATEIFCLGRNKNGSPKHPLYVASNKVLELFLSPTKDPASGL